MSSKPSNQSKAHRVRPTLRDVAAFAKVDPSVVSRVINEDPRLSIAPETRARVIAGIEKLGYRPNVIARELRLARTMTIGFVLPDLQNPVYGQIIQGAQRRAQEAGYAIVIGSPLEGRAMDDSFTRLLHQGRFDGLLIASATLDDKAIRDLAARPAPIVIVNRRVEGVDSSVIVDDAAGSRLATEHLLGLGHRFLAHISGPLEVDTSLRRKQGFDAAVGRLRARKAIVIAADGYDAHAGLRAMRELLARNPEVTAVFAANVMIAIGAIRAALDEGRRVPGDLSVIALHDFPLAELLEPPLSTVRMPLAELGSEAVDLLLRRIEGKPERSRMVPTPPAVVDRGSTGPAPA
jgi:LacI family transcriptional regulator, galactose operon repressor